MDAFEASGAFPGPSLYFHERAIALRRRHESLDGLLADDRFLEYVYAVLPAWGMHRMGPQTAKVDAFQPLVDRLRGCAALLGNLWQHRITELDEADVHAVADVAWAVISTIRVSTSATQIVAGSKTLHHLLPDLIPPIDRQYTFRFFTGQKAVTSGDGRAFREWMPAFARIGRQCRDDIAQSMSRGGFMATGEAKVIDNAIMGFMRNA